MKRAALFASLGLVMLACSEARPPSAPTPPPRCGPYSTERTSPFALPYRAGETYLVLQGNCAAFSHLASSVLRHAYDFRMAIGTPIAAVRPGVVVAVQESFTDGNRVRGDENLLIVSHGDGTFARYVHLTRNGALVERGGRVDRGDVIALSGDTGFSTEPHLHFDVTTGCPGWECETAATTFSNTDPHPNGLVQGRRYAAR